MTKALLKHVANQYILIVNERPRQDEWYYYVNSGQRYPITKAFEGYGKHSDWWRIIAAENLDGVKGIVINIKDPVNNDYLNTMGFDKYFESLIDTEVEVTEEEDYYLIKL